MPRKTGSGTVALPGCTTAAVKPSADPCAKISKVLSPTLKRTNSPPASDSSGSRTDGRRKARFSSPKTHDEFDIPRAIRLRLTLNPILPIPGP